MATATTTPRADGSFGIRVRTLREGMDLSLRDLAERSGVSAPMISQVERGETSPTLTVAERIASGMELTLSQLLRIDDADGVSLVRAADRRHGGHAKGHRYEVLTPPLPGLRAAGSRPPPTRRARAGGGRAPPPMHERGAGERAVVLRGRLRLVCGGMPHD